MRRKRYAFVRKKITALAVIFVVQWTGRLRPQKNNSLRCHFCGASSGTRRKPKGFRNSEPCKITCKRRTSTLNKSCYRTPCIARTLCAYLFAMSTSHGKGKCNRLPYPLLVVSLVCRGSPRKAWLQHSCKSPDDAKK